MFQLDLQLLSIYNNGALHQITYLDSDIRPINRQISKDLYSHIFYRSNEYIYIRVDKQLHRDLRRMGLHE